MLPWRLAMQIKLSLVACENTAESGSQPLLTLEIDAQPAFATLGLPRPTTVSSAISAAMALHRLIPLLGFVCRMRRGNRLDPSLAAVS